MKLSDLITDAGGSTLSHTKLWANIGYFAATISFLRMNFNGEANPEIWLIFLGCATGATTLSKLISLKYLGKVSTEIAP